jgi:hypothetical protein
METFQRGKFYHELATLDRETCHCPPLLYWRDCSSAGKKLAAKKMEVGVLLRVGKMAAFLFMCFAPTNVLSHISDKEQ